MQEAAAKVVEVASYYCYYYGYNYTYRSYAYTRNYCNSYSYYYTNCCRYSGGEPLWEIIMWCSIACILICLSVIGGVIRNKRRQAMYNQMAIDQSAMMTDTNTQLYGGHGGNNSSSSSGKKRNHHNA